MKTESEHLQSNEAKWDAWADSLDGRGWKYDFLRKAQHDAISLLDLKEGVRFLDVGCGTGWAIGEAARTVNNRGTFYGVDLSLKMIEKARKSFQGNENVRFIKATAESIPLDSDSFDVIICTNSFHHYWNPAKVVQEIHRLLKRGGRICILDPTADGWIVRLIDRIGRLLEPEHVKLYSTAEFQKLFLNGGLKYATSKSIRAYQKVHIGEKP